MSRSERIVLVDREKETLVLSTQAELLGLSRSSLYDQPRGPSARKIRGKHRIDEIYNILSMVHARYTSICSVKAK